MKKQSFTKCFSDLELFVAKQLCGLVKLFLFGLWRDIGLCQTGSRIHRGMGSRDRYVRQIFTGVTLGVATGAGILPHGSLGPCLGRADRATKRDVASNSAEPFLFRKNGEKGGSRLRAQNRRRPQKFLAEFFFPKTSSLLRKLSARRSRDVKGWSRASAPFAPSEMRRLVDEQVAPQAKNGRWV